MKTIISILSLCLVASLSAAEPPAKPDACCATEPKEKVACCGEDKSAAEKAACCAAEGAGKCAACCEEKPAAKDVCCAAMDPATFSKESLYQLDVKFTDDAGQAFTLGQLRGRPVVLTMFFASCGYACPLIVADMQVIRAKLPAELRGLAVFALVSFDVARDTPTVLKKYRSDRALDGQWTLLHGDDDAVRELAALLGVKYKQETGGMFSHSNLVTILNAEGEIVHQRTGLKGGLDEAAAAVVAASTR